MKYILTESQYHKLRFIRRVGEPPILFIKNLSSYKNACRYETFNHFIQRLVDDSLFHWMGPEDEEYIVNLIYGEMWDELGHYYSKKCGYKPE